MVRLMILIGSIAFSNSYSYANDADKINGNIEDEIKKSMEKEEIFKKTGGDKEKIYKSCPSARAWLPKDKTVDSASEWHIVPRLINSKTYGSKSHLSISIDDGKGTKLPIQCDYIRVVFDGSKIKEIDKSKCKSVEIKGSSEAECGKILGY